jgi:hypothetical protein
MRPSVLDLREQLMIMSQVQPRLFDVKCTLLANCTVSAASYCLLCRHIAPPRRQ